MQALDNPSLQGGNRLLGDLLIFIVIALAHAYDHDHKKRKNKSI